MSTGLDMTKYMEQVLDIQRETLQAIGKIEIQLARLEEWRSQVDAERTRGWQVKLALAASFLLPILSGFIVWRLTH